MKYYSIAIDGPSSSGKSTAAKAIAKELGFTYIDTGAMYRAITLKALRLKIQDLGNEENYKFIKDTKLEFVDNKMYMDGVDVSKEIREQDVVLNVSLVSSLRYVREELVNAQREFAKVANVCMDGRDIGTNVLKDATIKIFLVADVKERAKRRYLEQLEKGSTMTLDEVEKDLERRDYFDSHREFNPLRKAEDAIEIDTTSMTIEEVQSKIITLFKEFKHE